MALAERYVKLDTSICHQLKSVRNVCLHAMNVWDLWHSVSAVCLPINCMLMMGTVWRNALMGFMKTLQLLASPPAFPVLKSVTHAPWIQILLHSCNASLVQMRWMIHLSALQTMQAVIRTNMWTATQSVLHAIATVRHVSEEKTINAYHAQLGDTCTTADVCWIVLPPISNFISQESLISTVQSIMKSGSVGAATSRSVIARTAT